MAWSKDSVEETDRKARNCIAAGYDVKAKWIYDHPSTTNQFDYFDYAVKGSDIPVYHHQGYGGNIVIRITIYYGMTSWW